MVEKVDYHLLVYLVGKNAAPYMMLEQKKESLSWE
jgi:hypothetical protein